MGIIYQNIEQNFTVKITRNNCYPLHLHKEVEIFFVLDGAIDITIGSVTKNLTAGMFSIAFPNTVHETFTQNNSTAVMMIFDTELFPDFYSEFHNMTPENPFIDNSDFRRLIRPAIDSITECLETSCNTIDVRMLKGYVCVLLCHIFSALRLKASTDSTNDITARIASYINSHFKEELSLNTLASALGYSRYHISHIFSDKFNMSFTEYLGRIRAEHAMGLLTHSDMSITDICYNSGFNSIRTFYRVFENTYHCSPRSAAAKIRDSYYTG